MRVKILVGNYKGTEVTMRQDEGEIAIATGHAVLVEPIAVEKTPKMRLAPGPGYPHMEPEPEEPAV